MEDGVDIYSKTATGYSRHDHAVSIRSDETGIRLFDNACVHGSVECDMASLADKICDIMCCLYFVEEGISNSGFDSPLGFDPFGIHEKVLFK